MKENENFDDNQIEIYLKRKLNIYFKNQYQNIIGFDLDNINNDNISILSSSFERDIFSFRIKQKIYFFLKMVSLFIYPKNKPKENEIFFNISNFYNFLNDMKKFDNEVVKLNIPFNNNSKIELEKAFKNTYIFRHILDISNDGKNLLMDKNDLVQKIFGYNPKISDLSNLNFIDKDFGFLELFLSFSGIYLKYLRQINNEIYDELFSNEAIYLSFSQNLKINLFDDGNINSIKSFFDSQNINGDFDFILNDDIDNIKKHKISVNILKKFFRYLVAKRRINNKSHKKIRDNNLTKEITFFKDYYKNSNKDFNISEAIKCDFDRISELSLKAMFLFDQIDKKNSEKKKLKKGSSIKNHNLELFFNDIPIFINKGKKNKINELLASFRHDKNSIDKKKLKILSDIDLNINFLFKRRFENKEMQKIFLEKALNYLIKENIQWDHFYEYWLWNRNFNSNRYYVNEEIIWNNLRINYSTLRIQFEKFLSQENIDRINFSEIFNRFNYVKRMIEMYIQVSPSDSKEYQELIKNQDIETILKLTLILLMFYKFKNYYKSWNKKKSNQKIRNQEISNKENWTSYNFGEWKKISLLQINVKSENHQIIFTEMQNFIDKNNLNKKIDINNLKDSILSFISEKNNDFDYKILKNFDEYKFFLVKRKEKFEYKKPFYFSKIDILKQTINYLNDKNELINIEKIKNNVIKSLGIFADNINYEDLNNDSFFETIKKSETQLDLYSKLYEIKKDINLGDSLIQVKRKDNRHFLFIKVHSMNTHFNFIFSRIFGKNDYGFVNNIFNSNEDDKTVKLKRIKRNLEKYRNLMSISLINSKILSNFDVETNNNSYILSLFNFLKDSDKMLEINSCIPIKKINDLILFIEKNENDYEGFFKKFQEIKISDFEENCDSIKNENYYLMLTLNEFKDKKYIQRNFYFYDWVENSKIENYEKFKNKQEILERDDNLSLLRIFDVINNNQFKKSFENLNFQRNTFSKFKKSFKNILSKENTEDHFITKFDGNFYIQISLNKSITQTTIQPVFFLKDSKNEIFSFKGTENFEWKKIEHLIKKTNISREFISKKYSFINNSIFDVFKWGFVEDEKIYSKFDILIFNYLRSKFNTYNRLKKKMKKIENEIKKSNQSIIFNEFLIKMHEGSKESKKFQNYNIYLKKEAYFNKIQNLLKNTNFTTNLSDCFKNKSNFLEQFNQCQDDIEKLLVFANEKTEENNK